MLVKSRLRYDVERSLWILYFVTANCLSLTYSNLSQPSSSNKTLLLQPAGFVFDRAVAAFLSLDLHILENKLVSTLIPMQTWLESCKANVVWDYSREWKLNGSDLIQTQISPDPGEALEGGVCLRSEGSFSTSIFSQRKHCKKL